MPQNGSTLGNRAETARAWNLAAALSGSVEIKILLSFLLAMSVLLFGGAYTYRTSVELAGAFEWVAHTQQVRTTLADLYGSLAGAELAQRDYLLTAQQVRLDEHLRLVEAVQDRLADLRRLTIDNPTEQHNWSALNAAVKARLDDMAGGLAAYRDYGEPAARAVLGLGRPSSNTEEVRVITARMDAVEAGLLAQRQIESGNVRHTTLISLLVTLALASAIFAALFRGIHREMRARRGAEANLTAANRFLDSLIEHLPVMVFVKDALNLRFVRQNRACEALLGLSRQEMIGRPPAKSFRRKRRMSSWPATTRRWPGAGSWIFPRSRFIHGCSASGPCTP